MRRISPGTVTVGVFAILLGLVAAYVARRALDQQPPQVRPPSGVEIVVAERNMVEGSRVSSDEVRIINVPRDKVPEGVVRNMNAAVGRLTGVTITAGQPVLESMLAPIGFLPDYGGKLPPGFRAVTIAVAGTISSGAFVQNGDYVDISLTVESNHPAMTGSGVRGIGIKTLIRGVHVLAVGRERLGLSNRNNRAASIVVAVSPTQANRLMLAEKLGTLSVSLVSTEEQVGAMPTNDDSAILNLEELLGLEAPVPPAPPFTVQVYRGNSYQALEMSPSRIEESRRATDADRKRRPPQAVPTSVEPSKTPAGEGIQAQAPAVEAAASVEQLAPDPNEQDNSTLADVPSELQVSHAQAVREIGRPDAGLDAAGTGPVDEVSPLPAIEGLRSARPATTSEPTAAGTSPTAPKTTQNDDPRQRGFVTIRPVEPEQTERPEEKGRSIRATRLPRQDVPTDPSADASPQRRGFVTVRPRRTGDERHSSDDRFVVSRATSNTPADSGALGQRHLEEPSAGVRVHHFRRTRVTSPTESGVGIQIQDLSYE